MQHCPVCLGRVSSELFSSHMNSHSKDDVVSALLRQPLPGSLPNLQSFAAAPSLLQASNPGSNPALPTSIQNQVQNTLQAALSAPRTNVVTSSAQPLDLASQGNYFINYSLYFYYFLASNLSEITGYIYLPLFTCSNAFQKINPSILGE